MLKIARIVTHEESIVFTWVHGNGITRFAEITTALDISHTDQLRFALMLNESLHLGDVLPRPWDRRVMWVLIGSSVILMLSRYFGQFDSKVFSWLLSPLNWLGCSDWRDHLLAAMNTPPRSRLWQLGYWVAAHLGYYVVLPIFMIKFVFRARLRDFGLSLAGCWRWWWIVVLSIGAVAALVIIFGKTPSFQATYPFYKDAGKSWFDLLIWELIYGVQFFSVEFFFRGFMTHGLKERFGFYSVPIMTVPYCMIHFGKPFPETLGSILAGLGLGTLSLWSRSIWIGFVIHVMIAWSMDLTALYYKGQLQMLF